MIHTVVFSEPDSGSPDVQPTYHLAKNLAITACAMPNFYKHAQLNPSLREGMSLGVCGCGYVYLTVLTCTICMYISRNSRTLFYRRILPFSLHHLITAHGRVDVSHTCRPCDPSSIPGLSWVLFI